MPSADFAALALALGLGNAGFAEALGVNVRRVTMDQRPVMH